MRIDVTQEDIEKGVRRNCVDCPIGLAASRAFGTKRIEVRYFGIFVAGKAHMLPTVAKDFMQAFDADRPVSPFSFIAERIKP